MSSFTHEVVRLLFSATVQRAKTPLTNEFHRIIKYNGPDQENEHKSSPSRRKHSPHRRHFTFPRDGKDSGNDSASHSLTPTDWSSGSSTNSDMKKPTIFVKLPNGLLSTLRNLQNGTHIRDLKCNLELLSGLPSNIYALYTADGTELQDEVELFTNKSVRNGTVLRAQLYDTWEVLYTAVFNGDLTEIYYNSAIQILDVESTSGGGSDKPERSTAKRLIANRAFVALFLASFMGKQHVCAALISLGADTNHSTQYANTALHAAASQDHLQAMDLLIDSNANVRHVNHAGKSPLDVATECGASRCVKRLRLFQWSLENGNLVLGADAGTSRLNRYSKSHRSKKLPLQKGTLSRTKSAPGDVKLSEKSNAFGHIFSTLPNALTTNNNTFVPSETKTNSMIKECTTGDGMKHTMITPPPSPAEDRKTLTLEITLSPKPTSVHSIGTRDSKNQRSTDSDGFVSHIDRHILERSNNQESDHVEYQTQMTQDPYYFDRNKYPDICDDESDNCSCSARRIYPISKSPFRRISCSNAEEWLKSLPGRKTLDNWYPTLNTASQRRLSETDDEKEERRRRNEQAFAKWLQRKQTSGELIIEDGGDNDNEDKEVRKIKDRLAYNKWLERKKDYFKSKDSQKKTEQEERILQQLNNSTKNNQRNRTSFILECTDDSSANSNDDVGNSAAFQSWLRNKIQQGKQNKEQDKFESSRRQSNSTKQLDAKRRSDIGFVKTYGDWMSEKYEQQQISKQTIGENKKELERRNEEVKRGRCPRQISFDQWVRKIPEREQPKHVEEQTEGERKHRQLALQAWRQRHSKNWKTFDEWVRAKAAEAYSKRNESSANNNETDSPREKQNKTRLSFNDWFVAKEQEQLKIEEMRLQEEAKKLEDAKKDAKKAEEDRGRRRKLEQLQEQRRKLEETIKNQTKQNINVEQTVHKIGSGNSTHVSNSGP